MTSYESAGLVFAACALPLYAAGLWFLKNRNLPDKLTAYLFSAGYFADMCGTLMMMSDSDKPLTLAEAFSCTGMILMCAFIVIFWRYRLLDENETLPKYVGTLSKIAFALWLAAFLAGATLRRAGVNPVLG